MTGTAIRRRWDVFCRVIDNYGDAAVSWRLARQLAGEHDAQVRLWIDGLEALQMLCPEIACTRRVQSLCGVQICRWTVDAAFGAPADVVVDAFGGGLPDAYVETMALRDPRSLWIILEYLSAESWVGGHHGLPSPHPRLPLQRHFFFPGIVPGTGGVLKEASLDARRDAFRRDRDAQAGFWRDPGFEPPDRESVTVSLFGYDNPAAAELMHAWATGARPVVAAMPPSAVRRQACRFLGAVGIADGAAATRGSLEVRFLPFLPQPRYDELLWACDWNFVRGEDSFVRAQWALRPFVWHIYRQRDDAHAVKLEAFLDAYCTGLESGAAEALRGLWRTWNATSSISPGSIGTAWERAEAHRELLRGHARAWVGKLASPGELAANLVLFCAERLK